MKHILDAAGRRADLEAKLEAREQELRECTARYEELRHRIENDLQVLSSAFSMLARINAQGDNCVHCVSRVRSTAALYQTLDLTGADVISMGDYLSALSEALFNSFGDRIAIASVVEENINLDQRRAQRVGLIYAEAAMNAAKHAFPSDAGGKVDVRFRRVGDAFEMTVSDDGVGFSPDSAQPGHGLKLMKQFAQQLDGSLQLEKLPTGTRVKLTFAAAV
jgi:two-component sensor histidine kinase